MVNFFKPVNNALISNTKQIGKLTNYTQKRNFFYHQDYTKKELAAGFTIASALFPPIPMMMCMGALGVQIAANKAVEKLEESDAFNPDFFQNQIDGVTNRNM